MAYSAMQDGAISCYIGRQEGDTLVCDDEVLGLVYLCQWWLQAPGKVWGDVLSLATLVLLVALCFVRGKLKAPDS